MQRRPPPTIHTGAAASYHPCRAGRLLPSMQAFAGTAAHYVYYLRTCGCLLPLEGLPPTTFVGAAAYYLRRNGRLPFWLAYPCSAGLSAGYFGLRIGLIIGLRTGYIRVNPTLIYQCVTLSTMGYSQLVLGQFARKDFWHDWQLPLKLVLRS